MSKVTKYTCFISALFCLFALSALPAHGSTSEGSEPLLVKSTVAVQLAPSSAVAPVPEIPAEQLGDLLVQALAGRQWSLLLSVLVVGVVLLLRKVGAKLLPWLGTERGTAVLALVGGTSSLLTLALSQGQPFSLSLLLSCLMGALSASGLWSVSKSLARPRATAGPICLPEEVANGTCKPN